MQELLDGLGHDAAQRAPAVPGMGAQVMQQADRELDREGDRRRWDIECPDRLGALHVAAGLALGELVAAGKVPGGLGNGLTGAQQLGGRIDPTSTLVGRRPATHDTGILLQVSSKRAPSLDSWPRQHRLELEVRYCVGGVISPLLANLFMHYCFDLWMARTFPTIQFERYCDDIVVHCVSKAQAECVKGRIAQRLKECKLELSLEKTRIVYCKDDRRREAHPCVQFVFASYEFRARRVRTKDGKYFDGFNPAISPKELQRLRDEIRDWKLTNRTDKGLTELAGFVNRKVRGWFNYYGAFFKSALNQVIWMLNQHLAGWARSKFKRLHRSWLQAFRFLNRVARQEPGLFVHWRRSMQPSGWVARAG